MSRIGSAPIKQQPILKTGLFSVPWIQWFQEAYKLISGNRPFPLQSYLVADLPDAADWPFCLIYVSDAATGAIPAFSDGTDWRRVDTRAIIS